MLRALGLSSPQSVIGAESFLLGLFGGVLGERTGVRWIGNEDGIAPLPNPCDSDEPAFSSLVESPLRNSHAFSTS